MFFIAVFWFGYLKPMTGVARGQLLAACVCHRSIGLGLLHCKNTKKFIFRNNILNNFIYCDIVVMSLLSE